MATKPTVANDDWTDGDSAKVTEPSAGKKLAGFIAEKPAFQHHNWLWWRSSEWLQYLEDVTDELLSKIGDPEISNLDLSYSAGVLSVTGQGAVPLSSSNKGVVRSPSTVGGQSLLVNVTTPFSFNDDAHASSDLTGMGLGITEAVDWQEDLPIWVYLANRNNTDADGADGNSAIFIARNPNLRTTPSAANDIGDKDAIPVNDSQNVILLLGSYTQANYTSLPCVLIGCFRMRWLASSTDWTVQALDSADGFGHSRLNRTFSKKWTMPLGQNSASAGTFLLPNGGTAPIFAVNRYSYVIGRDGLITIYVHLETDGGTDGAGAVQSKLALPTDVTFGQAISTYDTNGLITAQTTVGTDRLMVIGIFNGPNPIDLGYDNAGVFAAVQNAMFSNGDRKIRFKTSYHGF